MGKEQEISRLVVCLVVLGAVVNITLLLAGGWVTVVIPGALIFTMVPLVVELTFPGAVL